MKVTIIAQQEGGSWESNRSGPCIKGAGVNRVEGVRESVGSEGGGMDVGSNSVGSLHLESGKIGVRQSQGVGKSQESQGVGQSWESRQGLGDSKSGVLGVSRFPTLGQGQSGYGSGRVGVKVCS